MCVTSWPTFTLADRANFIIAWRKSLMRWVSRKPLPATTPGSRSPIWRKSRANRSTAKRSSPAKAATKESAGWKGNSARTKPKSPLMNHSLLLCLLSVLAFCTSVAAQAPSSANLIQTQALGSFNILDFGAVGDGQTDCTTAIQKSIDAASQKGGLVVIPAGRWRCNGHLELKMGVHLSGLNQAPQSWEPATGSILLPTEGRDHEDGPAFIEMRSSTSLKGITVYYPEQRV